MAGMRWSAAMSGHRLVAQGQPGEHRQRVRSRGRPHDPVVGAVAASQITADGRGHRDVVVDGEDGGLGHTAASVAAPRRSAAG